MSEDGDFSGGGRKSFFWLARAARVFRFSRDFRPVPRDFSDFRATFRPVPRDFFDFRATFGPVPRDFFDFRATFDRCRATFPILARLSTGAARLLRFRASLGECRDLGAALARFAAALARFTCLPARFTRLPAQFITSLARSPFAHSTK